MSSNPPGLNRGDKVDKPANPDKPGKPSNPGTEDKSDRKAQKGEHIYTYDCLNRMVSSSIAGTFTSYTYDTLGNLTLETVKNKSVDYIYNELNQLVRKTTSTNDVYTYSYDKRGNRVAEIGPKASQEFVFDTTNRMVSGTNWKGDESAYTYNGLGIRVNNTHTTHAGQVYERDYVIDYTSFENDDLYVYAMGNGQLEYEQLHVYAGSERIEQFTERGNGNWERTLYVHEDVMGNTRYYTKTNGQSFAELEYDAWGMPASPNKLLNNDHGNYVFATFTGHIYDTTLDMYFAEARFYDAGNRQWLSMDPVKDGLNWYLYCGANPTTYWDPTGLVASKFNQLKGSGSGFLSSVWDFLSGSAALDTVRDAEHARLEQSSASGRAIVMGAMFQLDRGTHMWGSAAWFALGVITPVVENWTAPYKKLANILTKPFTRGDTYGFEDIPSGITDCVTPEYEVPGSFQNEFAYGRIVGHSVTRLLNGISIVAGGALIFGGSSIGGLLAPVTGGASAAVGIAVASLGFAMVSQGVAGLAVDAAVAADPNIWFYTTNNNSNNTNSQNNYNWGNPETLDDHFQRHGSDVGATDAYDYAKIANEFYNNRMNYQVKVDSHGITRVYDPQTNLFGSYNADGTTRTLFSPTRGQAYFDSQPGVIVH